MRDLPLALPPYHYFPSLVKPKSTHKDSLSLSPRPPSLVHQKQRQPPRVDAFWRMTPLPPASPSNFSALLSYLFSFDHDRISTSASGSASNIGAMNFPLEALVAPILEAVGQDRCLLSFTRIPPSSRSASRMKLRSYLASPSRGRPSQREPGEIGHLPL